MISKSQSFSNISTSYGFDEKINKFVLFSLNNSLFGVPVEQVTQVIRFEKVYDIPGSASYVIGATNLRGHILPLINLKKKLILSPNTPNVGQDYILFIEINSEIIGMVVDNVSTLISLPHKSIVEDLEMISTQVGMEFLKGAVSIDEQIIVLLNLDMILSEYELQEILQAHKESDLDLPFKKESTKEDAPIKKIDLNFERDEFKSYSKETENQKTESKSKSKPKSKSKSKPKSKSKSKIKTKNKLDDVS